VSAAQILAFGVVSQNDNQTRYFAIGGALNATPTATEASRQVTMRVAGTFANLYCRVTSNACTVSSTVTVRKNGAGTALTLTIGSDATGEFEDATHSDTVAAGDEVNYEVAIPPEAGTNTMTLSMFGVTFAAATDTATVLTTADSLSFSTASSTQYMSLVNNDVATTEANAQWTAQGGFTGTHLFVNVSSNARTTNTVFRSRKNTADGNLTLTFGSGETGIKEDTSNTDTLTAGDVYDVSVTTGSGTGSISVPQRAITLISTNRAFPVVGSAIGAVYSPTAGTTAYLHGGYLPAAKATESEAQLLSRITCTLSHLTAHVSANSVATTATTFKSRIGGADGNQLLSFAAAETGTKTDASNTDALTAGSSRYCVQVIVPATSGSITLRNVGLMGASEAGVIRVPSLYLNQSVNRAATY